MESFISAVREGKLTKVRDFLKADDSNFHIDANIEDNLTPLYIATEHGHEIIVKLLLEHGANVDAQDKDGKTVLQCAVTKGYVKIVKHILKYCPDVNNKSNKSSLNIAVQGRGKQYKTIVENLLQYGFTVNPEDINDCELMHAAVEKGYLKIVDDLVKSGADVNMLSRNKDTPLHSAIQNFQRRVATLLINSGANVNAKRQDETTALHIAAYKGCLEIVETLLKFGADIDSRDEHGETALHMASKAKHKQIVVVLLEHGSDINIMSNSDLTPCEYVRVDVVDQNYEKRLCITDVFEQQIIKLLIANLYVCESNLHYLTIRSMAAFDNIIWEKCGEEIKRMKSENIVMNNNVSFYNILTQSINIIALYAKNESIVQVLNSDDYKTKFPLYASMINCQFKKGMERKELLTCIELPNSLFNNLPQLPYNCMEKIFSYLSNKDLRMIIDACK